MGLQEGHAYLAIGFSFVVTGACVWVIVADWNWEGENGREPADEVAIFVPAELATELESERVPKRLEERKTSQ